MTYLCNVKTKFPDILKYKEWIRLYSDVDFQQLRSSHKVDNLETKEMSDRRFEIIKKSYLSGDRAPIDTTEALTQLQNFEILLTQANVDLQKARYELSNFFWTENGIPFELDENTIPFNSFESENAKAKEIGNLEEMITQATQNHPKIKMTSSKLNILDIEKRLKTIELFPALKLNYNVS